MTITPQKIGLGFLLLFQIFGSIALILTIWFNITKFSIKQIKILSFLAIIIQFFLVIWYVYTIGTKPDNLDYSPSAILFFIYPFHIIPWIVITYLFLIRLLFLLNMRIRISIVMIFVTIIPLYFILNYISSILVELLNIKINSITVLFEALIHSSILLLYPTIKLFQIWKLSKTLDN